MGLANSLFPTTFSFKEFSIARGTPSAAFRALVIAKFVFALNETGICLERSFHLLERIDLPLFGLLYEV